MKEKFCAMDNINTMSIAKEGKGRAGGKGLPQSKGQVPTKIRGYELKKE